MGNVNLVLRPPSQSLYVKLHDWGICSQLNNYCFSFIYATLHQQTLYVSGGSCISPDFNIVREVLQPYSYVKHRTMSLPNTFHSPKVIEFCRSLPRAQVKSLHRKALTLNRPTRLQVEKLIEQRGWSKVPFHIGIHYRSGDKVTSGEMRPVSLRKYVEAFLKSDLSRPVTHVFIMSDNYKALQDLQRELTVAVKASPATKTELQFYSPCEPSMTGHQQKKFNTQTVEKKKADLIQLLAELHIMQRIPTLLLLLSSNIDRLIYNSHVLADEQIQLHRIDNYNLIG